jgi:hypothetical protein
VLVPTVTFTESALSTFFALNSLPDSGLLQPASATFRGGQAVRLYADPGTIISCLSITPGPNPIPIALFISCNISGYSASLP